MKFTWMQWRSRKTGALASAALVAASLLGCRLSGFVLGIKEAAISRSGDAPVSLNQDLHVTNVVVLPEIKQ